jgi:hypothetical protein
VLHKVREISAGAHLLRIRSIEAISGPRGKAGYSSRPAEFRADFELIAKRTLSTDDWAVFSAHHLMGNEWRVCCQRLGMSRGNYFHAVYKLENELGRVFRELKPYPLYPLDEYFQPVTRTVDARPFPVPQERYPNGEPLRPPLAQRAAVARPQPVLVVCKPEPAPVPVVPAVAWDPSTIADHIRSRFRAGLSPWSITRELNRLQVPTPNGAPWRECEVKRSLLQARNLSLRKAA